MEPPIAEGAPESFQLHLVLPYKFQPRDDARVRDHLARGYRITQLQRLSDREVLITFARRPAGAAAAP